MPAILSRLSMFFINYISRDLDNTKIYTSLQLTYGIVVLSLHFRSNILYKALKRDSYFRVTIVLNMSHAHTLKS